MVGCAQQKSDGVVHAAGSPKQTYPSGEYRLYARSEIVEIGDNVDTMLVSTER
jgi:hypothetical protein